MSFAMSDLQEGWWLSARGIPVCTGLPLDQRITCPNSRGRRPLRSSRHPEQGTRNSPQESAVPCAFFRFQSARRVGRLMDLRQAPYLRVGGYVGLCDHPSHDFRYHVIRI